VRVDGKWIGWGLGDAGVTVTAIKSKLKAKFSYAAGLDDSEYFGEDLQAVVIIYQTRKNAAGLNLRTDGVVDYATQVALGLVEKAKHAVITFNGTWGNGLVQYPGNVVNGLAEFIDKDLCFEVNCPYPATMGFIQGGTYDPSYRQSVGDAISWVTNWLKVNPTQTFAFASYSQGAEAASRIAMELMDGSLKQYLPRFIGGVTFGNPCRGEGFIAPTVADPGGHGISPTRMTHLPTIRGITVWADYVHSKANGDAGDDMYAVVPSGKAGEIMGDVYDIATHAQVNDFGAFASDMVNDITETVVDAVSDIGAAGLAAMRGIEFLAAPGGITAPHISYLGELGGYTNLVAPAVGFLQMIATLTPAHN